MMRRRFLFIVICLAALSVAAAPVAASTTTTGTRIDLRAAPVTFPAGAPFYVEHGSVCEPAAGDTANLCMNANTHFDLYLDGAIQPSTLVIENSPDGWAKLNLTNYPDGLSAGRHTFVGVWVQGGNVALILSARISFTR